MRSRLAAVTLVAALAVPHAAAGQVRYIDTHAHLHGLARGQADYPGAAAAAVRSMDEFGAARMIVLPPPFVAGMPGIMDVDTLLDGTRGYPGRFAVVAGGGSLNPLIVEAVRSGSMSEQIRARFAERAEALATKPIVGFGEMTTEHFSLGPGHPYITAPADHPLYLLLADIAAKTDLPIDLHMEAIDTEAAIDPRYRSPNPAKLTPNVPAFERLLSHNRGARIVWTHLGWDNTGQRTPALTRRLLAAHPNLYVATKQGPDSLPVNRVFDRDTGIEPAWRAVIDEFPDRFLVATDQFHVSPLADLKFPRHPATARLILDKLPPDLAHKIGVENALKVYPRLAK
jgi:hypothetical protein